MGGLKWDVHAQKEILKSISRFKIGYGTSASGIREKLRAQKFTFLHKGHVRNSESAQTLNNRMMGTH